jgi:hypothetical protein
MISPGNCPLCLRNQFGSLTLPHHFVCNLHSLPPIPSLHPYHTSYHAHLVPSQLALENPQGFCEVLVASVEHFHDAAVARARGLDAALPIEVVIGTGPQGGVPQVRRRRS